MNIDLGTVQEILREQKVDAAVIQTVVQELQKVAAEEKADKEPSGPKQKYQYSIIVNSPTNDLNNLQGWVVKMPEDQKPSELLAKIQTAAAKQNNGSRKGRKNPIRSLSEAFLNLKRKFTKTENFQHLTRESVQVIVSDGTL